MGRQVGAFSSLSHALQLRAEAEPDKPAYVFLGDGERESGRQTYGQLDASARRIGSFVRHTYGEGARVLLLFSDGLEFVQAFFGCLYAGVVPVPAYPPFRSKRLKICAEIARKSGATGVLTTYAQADAVRRALSRDPLLDALPLAMTDTCPTAGANFMPKACTEHDLAFIQFTSGSTGDPKGVVVAHGSLLNNERAIAQAFRNDSRTISVGWLPLFHDMGLIGNVLQPIFLGTPAYLMPPAAFLQKPARWLEAISRYRATSSGAPNFAYELCIARVTESQKAGLDLRSWSVAFNGAEPMRAETLERFSEAFAPCGFAHRAHYPCYGMAESTLFVAGGAHGTQTVIAVDVAALERDRIQLQTDPQRPTKRMVACGTPRLGNEICIADPDTHAVLDADHVGEIWLRGPSVASGYCGEPPEVQRVFRAGPNKSVGDWFRTGDLGCIHSDQLYVTGRLNDLIKLHGRSIYPQDIELTCERSHPDVASGRVAAFTIREGTLVVLVEIDFRARSRANPEEIIASVRDATREQHGLTPHEICVLGPSALPLTSSGKVRRRHCRELYLGQQLPRIDSDGMRELGAHFTRVEASDSV